MRALPSALLAWLAGWLAAVVLTRRPPSFPPAPAPCGYAGRKVMLGVDRLDMIKGIPQVRRAFFPGLLPAHACFL